MPNELRDRFRAQVRDEVKQVALQQLADGGPQALSLNAIAKALGVSGPALYRYFANRDALLTELIIDAYHDFGAALGDAVTKTRGDRLRAIVGAYRDWALAEPYRYRLLFGAPLPGYDAQAERLVEASQLAMKVVLEVTTGLGLPAGGRKRADAELVAWAERHGYAPVDAPAARAAITAWARMHGLVSLEIEGNFASMGLDPRPLYDTVIADLTD